nr:Chain C, KDA PHOSPHOPROTEIN [Human betaherpesvirus 5]2X4R_F Chain F, KDA PHOSPHOPROTEIN [Human betaherpesvirus 5]3GSN_P Chain P, HCMV pp65 fragment 495-503 (NLVPMVATV) [synthetic construct]3GSO_P Chain P, HCMV pp65 fragment 495-503 (NLVPMVATV) [synthetic construct]5D2L_Q Chain Q, ASN-LEU-VAL-PRO-MET-VAL-ALA-THR-VAL [Cytomegalovirus]5D2L_R Chain R, ASN-LEU-VAL-PRO-MET-VAL-ALA-THR-VAL [Cytomegalovirus]5D2L_T Chain T, ASN-LEU-VAL-PRO-MET-VAL-ALA-THR-VAL [Cytomegalovirus]5D2L_U Chain U, ASN-L
NLVPMVATV